MAGEKLGAEILLKANARSASYPLPAPGTPVVLAKRAVGGTGLVKVAEVSVPTGQSPSKLIYLLISKDASQVRAFILDDGPAVFPVNTLRVLNASGAALLLRANSFNGELAAGQTTPMVDYPDMKSLPANSLAKYPFGVAIKGEGGTEVLNAGFREAAPGTRSLLVILPPREAGSNKVRVVSILDRPPPPPAQQNKR